MYLTVPEPIMIVIVRGISVALIAKEWKTITKRKERNQKKWFIVKNDVVD